MKKILISKVLFVTLVGLLITSFTRGQEDKSKRPSPPATVTGNELSLISFNVTAVDPDTPSDTLSYQLLQGPPGLSISAAGQVFGVRRRI